MRSKINQLEVDGDEHGYGNFKHGEFPRENRLDLNVLLKRIEDRKKIDKKTNVIIFSGVALIAVIAVLLIAIIQN